MIITISDIVGLLDASVFRHCFVQFEYAGMEYVAPYYGNDWTNMACGIEPFPVRLTATINAETGDLLSIDEVLTAPDLESAQLEARLESQVKEIEGGTKR